MKSSSTPHHLPLLHSSYSRSLIFIALKPGERKEGGKERVRSMGSPSGGVGWSGVWCNLGVKGGGFWVAVKQPMLRPWPSMLKWLGHRKLNLTLLTPVPPPHPARKSLTTHRCSICHDRPVWFMHFDKRNWGKYGRLWGWTWNAEIV